VEHQPHQHRQQATKNGSHHYLTHGLDAEAAKPPPALAPIDKTQANIGAGATIVGGAMLAAGSFLPWITASTGFGSVSRGGMEGGDGVVILIAGGVTVLGGVAGLMGSTGWVVAAIAAVIGGLIGFVDFQDIQERISGIGDSVIGEVGIGLWLILAGAVVALVGAGISALAPKQASDSGR
jgi:hypothetical protein